ncbi:unnamed protein product [Dibothriocephalus latus]|uniref:Uncharacterized protein n=1 Tax=Dibothriocephalus latus TaxID=60516 RepID=A0A3P6TD93_DIBLA|nr:unnamed protein product [Dibothriocephalus latus]
MVRLQFEQTHHGTSQKSKIGLWYMIYSPGGMPLQNSETRLQVDASVAVVNQLLLDLEFQLASLEKLSETHCTLLKNIEERPDLDKYQDELVSVRSSWKDGLARCADIAYCIEAALSALQKSTEVAVLSAPLFFPSSATHKSEDLSAIDRAASMINSFEVSLVDLRQRQSDLVASWNQDESEHIKNVKLLVQIAFPTIRLPYYPAYCDSSGLSEMLATDPCAQLRQQVQDLYVLRDTYLSSSLDGNLFSGKESDLVSILQPSQNVDLQEHLTGLIRQVAQAFNSKPALIQERLDEVLRAADQCESSLTASPSSSDMAQLYYLRGRAFNVLSAEETPTGQSQAKSCLLKSLKLDPNLSDAWCELAEVSWMEGDPESAIAPLRSALKHNVSELSI